MRILFKTTYKQDLNLAKHGGHRFWYGLLILVLFAAPLILGGYYIGEATRILIYAMAGLGLMVLTGFTGQVSLGHAAFLAIGAYTNAWFLAQGFSSFVALPMAALLSMIGGLLVAIPAARMSGIYLAIATLAFAIIVEDFAGHLNSITGGNRGLFHGSLLQDHRMFLYCALSTMGIRSLCISQIGGNNLRMALHKSIASFGDNLSCYC